MFPKNLRSLTKFIGSLAVVVASFSAQLTKAAFTPPSPAESLTLGWDPNPEPNLQDYRVYVGTQTGQYTRTYDAGTATSILVDQLEPGQTYHFVVVAIDSSGLESPPSVELAVTIATPPLPSECRLIMGETGKIDLLWTFPASAMSSSPEFTIQASSDLVNWTQVATVLAENSLGADGPLEYFSWSLPATGERKFYRLTATNWLGSSTAP